MRERFCLDGELIGTALTEAQQYLVNYDVPLSKTVTYHWSVDEKTVRTPLTVRFLRSNRYSIVRNYLDFVIRHFFRKN